MIELDEPEPFSPEGEYRAALHDCRELYRLSALDTIREHPGSITGTHDEFLRRMLDLHHGLVLKVFVEIAHIDWKWSKDECRLGVELVEHVWSKRLAPSQIKTALEHVLTECGLAWETLVGPFTHYPAFRERASVLHTAVMRMANLIAKADGRLVPEEVRQLQWIEAELKRLIFAVPLAEFAPPQAAPKPHSGVETAEQESTARLSHLKNEAPPQVARLIQPCHNLDEALAELDRLVGLDAIKQEVRGLINFLKIQQERKRFNLPTAQVSLHSIFTGNPGTGKTSVARLLGKLLGAIGFVSKGHLIETDRSGLVAEYAGQTGPRTNKRIDEALDGVLFIDEAYSLVAERGDDPYGAEAVQTLLKRMEDARHRLVVVLAGYPGPMERMLKSNPGLSSRFSRSFQFPDYTASELGRIFENFCRDQHYRLPLAARVKLLLGFQYLIERRDEHFGNGRLARNVFERAIGRLANRIAAIVPLTHELLTTFEAEDVEIEGVPAELLAKLDDTDRRFQICCPGCRQCSPVPQEFLVRKIRCKQCSNEFTPEWGEPIALN